MIEPPEYPREGVWQMRPALLGWQYRTRPYGFQWGDWAFKFGRKESVRARVQANLGERFVEVPEEQA